MSAGAWAKKYHLASRAAMEAVLRPHDLGTSQWYVLYHLAGDGPTGQRELVRLLDVERATPSGVVAVLVRKGLVDQTADPSDQRQKVLQLTDAVNDLWDRLPDPIAVIQEVAFSGFDDADHATTVRVLSAATQRLTTHVAEGKKS